MPINNLASFTFIINNNSLLKYTLLYWNSKIKTLILIIIVHWKICFYIEILKKKNNNTNIAPFTFKTNNNGILKYMFFYWIICFSIEIVRKNTPNTNLAPFTFQTNNNSILKYMFYIEIVNKNTPNTNLGPFFYNQ